MTSLTLTFDVSAIDPFIARTKRMVRGLRRSIRCDAEIELEVGVDVVAQQGSRFAVVPRCKRLTVALP